MEPFFFFFSGYHIIYYFKKVLIAGVAFKYSEHNQNIKQTETETNHMLDRSSFVTFYDKKKCQSLINCQALLRGYFGRWERFSTYYCREEVTSPGEMAVIRGSTM